MKHRGEGDGQLSTKPVFLSSSGCWGEGAVPSPQCEFGRLDLSHSSHGFFARAMPWSPFGVIRPRIALFSCDYIIVQLERASSATALQWHKKIMCLVSYRAGLVWLVWNVPVFCRDQARSRNICGDIFHNKYRVSVNTFLVPPPAPLVALLVLHIFLKRNEFISNTLNVL